MNGRVYDPATAQFFSPDPFVQSPGDWQNYNRYAYCLNNPVMYTDPSGYQYDYASPEPEYRQTEMPGNRDTGFRNNFNYWSAHQGSISYNDDGKYYYSGGGEASWGEARGYLFRWSDVTYRSNGKEAISFLNAVSANSNSTSLVLFGYQSNKQTNTWKYIQYNTNTLKCYIPYTNIEYNTSGSDNSVEQDDSILDGIQTFLDVAGIADPTGIVDGINALIYAGRGQLGNAAISALAIIPYVGDIGKAGRLGAKTTRLSYELIYRAAKGADGGISRHVIERLDEEVISKTHQVFKDGKIIHQHQNHIGTYGTIRTFPEEWLLFPTIK